MFVPNFCRCAGQCVCTFLYHILIGYGYCYWVQWATLKMYHSPKMYHPTKSAPVLLMINISVQKWYTRLNNYLFICLNTDTKIFVHYFWYILHFRKRKVSQLNLLFRPFDLVYLSKIRFWKCFSKILPGVFLLYLKHVCCKITFNARKKAN